MCRCLDYKADHHDTPLRNEASSTDKWQDKKNVY